MAKKKIHNFHSFIINSLFVGIGVMLLCCIYFLRWYSYQLPIFKLFLFILILLAINYNYYSFNNPDNTSLTSLKLDDYILKWYRSLSIKTFVLYTALISLSALFCYLSSQATFKFYLGILLVSTIIFFSLKQLFIDLKK